MALSNRSNDKNIIIQKSDKDNSVLLLGKDKYLEGMSKILYNKTKFETLQFDQDKELNYVFIVLNLEKKIIIVVENLNNKEEITEVDYNHPYPCGSYPGIVYGLAKVHKPVTDRCRLFDPFFPQLTYQHIN